MLENGGAERWVVDLCHLGRAENLVGEIAVLLAAEGLFSRKAREHNIPVHYCPVESNPLNLLWRLRTVLRRHGPFDAVHSHVHASGSLVCLAARLEGVPVRIAHSHNVIEATAGTLARWFYMGAARLLLRLFATSGLAPSAASGRNLFGRRWHSDARWSVFPCGIDLSPFRAGISAQSTREAFAIPPGALVLGSVGRLNAEKNSALLVDILAAVLDSGVDAYLLLVGDGPLRIELERRAELVGCRDRLLLAGVRSDVPALMRNVIDVFVFPSPPPPRGNEALPLTLVEAQAAGLPVVLSDGVPPEACLVPDLVVQVSAEADPATWARAIIGHAGSRHSRRMESALALVEATYHDCTRGLKVLAALYRDARLSPAEAVRRHPA